MTDLSKIPFEELKAEYLRRRHEMAEQRKMDMAKRQSCLNCIHRIRGKTNLGTLSEDTWVCEAKPKQMPRKYNRGPVYQQIYRKCNYTIGLACTDFINRLSDEGKALMRGRQTMADRFPE